MYCWMFNSTTTILSQHRIEGTHLEWVSPSELPLFSKLKDIFGADCVRIGDNVVLVNKDVKTTTKGLDRIFNKN